MNLQWTARTDRLALLLLAVLAATPMMAGSTRPQYGGTLRIELHSAAVDIDPRRWKPGSPEFALGEHFASLLFDRLVCLDNYGRFQPQLAVEWSHDASFKRWQFVLRGGVKFSDGASLTAADVANSLRSVLPSGIQLISSGANILFQSSVPVPDLLEQLASGRSFVFRETPGGLVGTGPFELTPETEPPAGSSSHPSMPSAKLRFRVQEQSWAGRPFVDHVEATFGIPPLRALFDLQLGKADIVLLDPEVVRRASQSGVRVWRSDPVTVYLLLFDGASPVTADSRLREGVSYSLDRGTMAGVLLQKQADPAASLLPRWLSGYALLFNVDMNLPHARELRAALPPGAASSGEPLSLRVEAPGDLSKLLGERVGINVRQAGFFIRPSGRPATVEPPGAESAAAKTSLRLVAWRYTSLSPRTELESMVSSLNLEGGADSLKVSPDPQQLYELEKLLLDRREALPLVAFPDYVALGPAVRDWMPNSWGEWHLADVWLDRSEKSPSNSGTGSVGANPSPGALP